MHGCAVFSFGEARLARLRSLSWREQRPGPFSRLLIGRKHFRDGGGVSLRGCSEYFFNCIWDACEGNTTFEERSNGHLVCRVESDAVRSALFCGLEGQAQAGKALEIRLLKIEVP
jgi:hypothetical protein